MTRPRPHYVRCINNDDYRVSLDIGKLHRALPDENAEGHGMIRVIDESGEDYLFSRDRFVDVTHR